MQVFGNEVHGFLIRFSFEVTFFMYAINVFLINKTKITCANYNVQNKIRKYKYQCHVRHDQYI